MARKSRHEDMVSLIPRSSLAVCVTLEDYGRGDVQKGTQHNAGAKSRANALCLSKKYRSPHSPKGRTEVRRHPYQEVLNAPRLSTPPVLWIQGQVKAPNRNAKNLNSGPVVYAYLKARHHHAHWLSRLLRLCKTSSVRPECSPSG
jgi:hypothetical protein